MAIADRIVVLNRGRIEDAGPPERVYRRPASLFAAGFMGETNRIPARPGPAGQVVTPLGSVAVEAPAGAQRLVLCLRPERLRRAPEGGEGGWDLGPARLRDAAFLGTHWRVHVVPEAAPDLLLVAHLPPEAAPETVLRLHADPADLSVFAEDHA